MFSPSPLRASPSLLCVWHEEGSRLSPALTCAPLHVRQPPHGQLLSVVGLAGIAGRRPDALVAQSPQVSHSQLLTAAVAPELPADPLVKLLGEGLGQDTGRTAQAGASPSPASTRLLSHAPCRQRRPTEGQATGDRLNDLQCRQRLWAQFWSPPHSEGSPSMVWDPRPFKLAPDPQVLGHSGQERQGSWQRPREKGSGPTATQAAPPHRGRRGVCGRVQHQNGKLWIKKSVWLFLGSPGQHCINALGVILTTALLKAALCPKMRRESNSRSHDLRVHVLLESGVHAHTGTHVHKHTCPSPAPSPGPWPQGTTVLPRPAGPQAPWPWCCCSHHTPPHRPCSAPPPQSRQRRIGPGSRGCRSAEGQWSPRGRGRGPSWQSPSRPWNARSGWSGR